jgi:hypothetical protein
MGQLDNDNWLYPGDGLTSENGSAEFKIEDDGRMSIYWDGECVWQNTDEGREDIKGIHLQDDGNLVLYTHDDEPVWASNTEASSEGTSLSTRTFQFSTLAGAQFESCGVRSFHSLG